MFLLVIAGLNLGSTFTSEAASLTGTAFSIAQPFAGTSNVRYDWNFTTASGPYSLNKVKTTVPAGTDAPNRYLSLPGATNNNATTPDGPANSITGDIDIVVQVQPTDWTPVGLTALVSKYDFDSNQRSYRLTLGSDGKIGFWWSANGTTAQNAFSSGATGFTDGTTHWVRATQDVDDGTGHYVTSFYTSGDGVTWSPLGTSTGASVTSFFDSTAPLAIGTDNTVSGSTDNLTGRVYYAEVRNGINGAPANKFSAAEVTTSISTAAPTWLSTTGETWTVNRTAIGIPADISADLTVSTVSGVPAGGAATLRLLERQAMYFFTGTSIGSGVVISLGLTGFTNTTTLGRYGSTISTVDTTSVLRDSATTSTVAIYAGALTSPTMTTTNNVARSTTGFTYGFTTATPRTLSRVTANVPAGTIANDRYLNLEGVPGNFVTTPDSSNNSVAGDSDFRVKASLPSWTATDQYLLSKWNAGTQRSYVLKVNAGKPTFMWSPDGTAVNTATSTVSVPYAAGATGWVRATYLTSSGTVRFYTSTNGTSWTQLGATVVTSASPIFNSSTPLNIGEDSSGAGTPTAKIYFAEIRGAVDGGINCQYDPANTTSADPSNNRALSGENWNVVRTGDYGTADVQADLTTSGVTNLPAGTAALRMIDHSVAYSFAPTSVPASTAVSFSVSGLSNTTASGSYSPALTTFEGSGNTATAIDYGVPATASILANTATNPIWTASDQTTRATSQYTYGLRTGASQTLSAINMTVPTGTSAAANKYLSLPGVASNYASTPDSTANSFTGTIDARIKLAPDAWNPGRIQRLVSKYAGGSQNSYSLEISNSGKPQVVWSTTGIDQLSAAATVAPSYTDGQAGWLRYTFVPNNGSGGRVINFYTSTDGSSWTPLGSAVTGASTTIFDGTSPLSVGVAVFGQWAGKVYSSEIRNGIDGPVVSAFDPNEQSVSTPTSWKSKTGETWTVNRVTAYGVAADIASDLAVTSAVGIPTGGTATLRTVDKTLAYRFTPTPVGSNTAVSVSVSGVVNTATAGSTTSAVTTSDNSSARPFVVDSAVTSALTMTAFVPGSMGATLSLSNNATRSNAQYNWNYTTGTSSNLVKSTFDVPTGTYGADGNRYLALDGTAGNYASTADTGLNSVTGNIDIRARVSLNNWKTGSDQDLVSKFNPSTNQRSYVLMEDANGKLCLFNSADGIANAFSCSSVPTGFADGATKWLRATLEPNNGGNRVGNYYWSDDNVTWNQLGTAVTSTGANSIYDGTASVTIGQRGDGGNMAAGKFYYAEVRNGLNGTVVSKFDPNEAPSASPNTWDSTLATTENWAITRAGASPADLQHDLTTVTATGLPSGGTSTLRMIDHLVTYTFPGTRSVPSGTTATYSVSGLSNTAISGSYTSTVKTYENSSTSVVVDSGTTPAFNIVQSNAAGPTSLAQYKSNGTSSIGTGGWISAQSAVFKATATDADATNSDVLCIEAVPVASSFTGTPTACGTAYVAGGATASATLTGLAEGQYKWQARTKDIRGQYSAWSDFGSNGSAIDFGVDITGPAVGVVTQQPDTSLDTITASWTPFVDSASGTVTYSYAIGTTAGATDLVSWTANGASTSVARSGLVLTTSQQYFVSVKATDAAGNEGAFAVSDGTLRSPSLAFSLDSSALALGTVNPANNTLNGSVQTTVSTNAASGFQVRLSSTALPASAGRPITSTFAGTWASPSPWSGTGFAYTSSDTSIAGTNRFASGAYFANLPVSGTSDVIFDNPGPIAGTPITNASASIGLRVTVNPLQAAGAYGASLTFTAVPSF